ncbi:hypothetical protein ACLKA6_007363 [Drosophila palustris]
MPKIYKYIVIGICLILQTANAAESNENTCNEGQFQCNNGECINAEFKCNLKLDCQDESDETYEHCFQTKCSSHRCSYGACFEDSQYCNGKADCWDGTDEYEFNCVNETEVGELFNNKIRGECRSEAYTQFQCQQSKECISYSQVCDGVEHCRDKSDESSELCVGSFCPEGSFRCAYGACIAKTAACNHAIDCRDGSDELTSICNSWHNIAPEADWEISRWKITPVVEKHLPDFSQPVTTKTVAPQLMEGEKSCFVPTDDKALRVRTMYNGMPYNDGNDVSHQTTVRIVCSKQHVLKGTDVNTCDNGKWKAPWPKCAKVCDKSKITNDPRINAVCSYQNQIFDCLSNSLLSNTIAEVKCAQGYVPEGIATKVERICNNNGEWTRLNAKSPALKCKPDCGKTFSTVQGDPWLVSIYHPTSHDNYDFSCLGTIIDPFYVLTTASCFSPDPVPHAALVVLGNHSIGFNLAKEHGFDVTYIEEINVKDLKPLALLQMVNPFKLSAKVRPICWRNFSGYTSQEPVESWRALGEPLVIDALKPLAGLKPKLEPWQMIKWTDSQLSNMYKDWGIYYDRTQNLAASMEYFNKALNLRPYDTETLRRRGCIKRKQARAPEALLDSGKAKGILRSYHADLYDPKINLEVCDSLYESNRLEDSMRSLHHQLRIFSDTQAKRVTKRVHVITENINDALSDATAPAVHRLIDKMVMDKAKEPKFVKPDCDVVSMLEQEPELLSAIETKRRKREFKIYNQSYLNKCWTDVSFLKKIRENPDLLIKQFVVSSTHLKSLTEDPYKIVRTFTKMLHTRCPKYTHHIHKYPNEELFLKYQQENLFRIQYQTRRNMFKILRTIRDLIRNEKLQKLTNFVEEVMGSYVTIKTNRIMPWKFEFINEVYNYLGLARINEFKIPSDMKVLTGRQRLLTLFKLPTDMGISSTKARVSILRELVRRTNAIDEKAEKFKHLTMRYEYRMRFAKYPIERSYLLHELAQAHLDNNSFDTCCLLARQSIDEALRGRHYIWAVLSALVACKANAILGKVEKQKEMLTEAFKLAKKLKNIDLCLFIDICLKVNAEEIELKRQLITSDGNFRRRTRQSASSGDISISDSSIRTNESPN